MIQITCTNCKAVLSIDDAFAGGVCRCRHCGTIQTVPKHLRDSAPDGSGAVAQAGGKVLFQNKKATGVAEAGGSGTGLDDLANIVASSGLSSGRLRTPDGSVEESPRAAGSKTTLIIAAAGTIIVILLGVIVFMAVREKSGTSSPATNATTTPAPQADPNKLVWNAGETVKVTKAPQFLGQRIRENSVVYVIDRGQSAQAEGKFDSLKEAVIRSLETLGSGRKFQVVFWSLDNQVWAYPDSGLAPADPKRIAECRAKMDDVFASGQTKLSPALEKAFKSGAEAILLVPIKSLLDEGFHPMVMKTRGDSKAKIYTFSIDHSETGEVLSKVANQTGGVYYDLKMSDLRAAVQ